MQRALDEGARALSADAGTIEMREPPHWVVAYQCGFAAADVGLRLTDVEAPNATSVERRGEWLTIADMRGDATVDIGFVKIHRLRSVLGVPLLARQTVIGCLLFYGKDVRVFGDSQIDFARKLGATVSLALENARLLQAEVAARRAAQHELDTTALLLKVADSLDQVVGDGRGPRQAGARDPRSGRAHPCDDQSLAGEFGAVAGGILFR